MKFDPKKLRETATAAKEKQDQEEAAKRYEAERVADALAEEQKDRIVAQALKNLDQYIQAEAAKGEMYVTVLRVKEGDRRHDKATRLAWPILEAAIRKMGLTPNTTVTVIEPTYREYGTDDWRYDDLQARWDC